MLSRKTALIIGAGASAEIGLPTGVQLIKQIAGMLDFELDDWRNKIIRGDKQIFDVIKIACQSNNLNLQECYDAAKQISEGVHYAFSIDNYIDIHDSNRAIELCGKLAIAKAILEAEKSSRIFADSYAGSGRFTYSSVENTWYHRFLQMLHTNVKKKDIEFIFDNIVIISFNYDRCIEHFLVNALQPVYGLTQPEAESLTKKLKIFHPYGQVGYLPWQDSSNAKINFGSNVSSQQMLSVALSLKTFTEKVSDHVERDKMQEELSAVETMIFLGFGFYAQNMKLIKPKHSSHASKIFGTVYGVSSQDMPVVRDQLDNFVGHGVSKELLSQQCVHLFDTYWRSMSV